MRKILERLKQSKKGINAGLIFALAGSILAFVVMTIYAAIGGQIGSSIQSTQTTNTTAFNITGLGLTGLVNIGNQFPLLGTILIFSAVLVLLGGLFLGLGGRQGKA